MSFPFYSLSRLKKAGFLLLSLLLIVSGLSVVSVVATPKANAASIWSSCSTGLADSSAAAVTVVNQSGKCIITFKLGQIFTLPSGVISLSEALVVGGGGGGGFNTLGGGGGGGEVKYRTSSLSLSGITQLKVTIGAGGLDGWNGPLAANWTKGDNGNPSEIRNQSDALIIAAGGGGGGCGASENPDPSTFSGSSGGACHQQTKQPRGTALIDPTSGWTRYANGGGPGGSGGGGGAGQEPDGINGGNGIALTGGVLTGTYGGGGGGWNASATGGTGGGGNPITGSYQTAGDDRRSGTDGGANTGGGGGAAKWGGSGVVRVVYNIPITATFNSNYGTPTTSTQAIPPGVSTVLTANSFTRSGFTFAGWTANADGTGTTYTDGQSVTISADTPFYAKWIPRLSTPTLTATATTGNSNSISLAWGAIDNRSSYTVIIYNAAGTSALQSITGVTGTTLNITTSNYGALTSKSIYQFTVTAIATGGSYSSSLESAQVAAVTGSVSTTFTLSGTIITTSAFEGRELSVVPTNLPTGSYTYQWFGGNDTSTSTALTSASELLTSYTPQASDRSYATQKYLSVRVVATISGRSYTFNSPAVPVYTYPNATGASVTSSSGAAGTRTPGKYKVGDTVIGHPWQVMGTPWPTLTYQWYLCDTSAAAANVVSSLAATPRTCAQATGAGNSGTATRAAVADSNNLGGHRFKYVVTSEAAGKFLTFTATLTNEATDAQGTAFTITQSRIQHSGVIQTTQTITFPQPSDLAATSGDVTLTASSTSELAITYRSKTPTICTIVSGKLRPVSAGACVITASQAGNATYIAATSVDSATITISKGAQATLSIANSNTNISKGTNRTNGIVLATSGGSGSGAVSYQVVSGSGCTLNGSKLTVATSVTPGVAVSCTVTATKATDTKHLQAVSGSTTFTFS